jgi:uncharacterized protein YraI
MHILHLIFGTSIILFLTLGCGGSLIGITPTLPSATASFTPIATLTPGSTVKLTPIPSVGPSSSEQTSTPAGEPFIPYFVKTSADNVNLRTFPGTLFPVSRLLANGTRLKVLGHSPGGDWLYVQTDEQIFGWVLVPLVNGGQDGGPTPLIVPQNVQVIKGQVVDLLGVPISGIGFAITQGSGPKAPRTDATTDATGNFFAYLPLSASGQWMVSYVSVACTSNTMNANCNCINKVCGRANPDSVIITLPASGVLQFVWK